MRHLGTAYKSLRLRPLRSILTMLGVIIGVLAIYIMVSIAYASTQTLTDLTSSVYAKSLNISPNRGISFTERDVKELEFIDGIDAINGFNSSRHLISSDSAQKTFSITGTDANFLLAKDLRIDIGRNLTQNDLQSKATVAVLSANINKDLFGENYPLGQTIRIKGVPFKVIGVIAKNENPSSFSTISDNVVLIPRTTFRSRITGHNARVKNNVDALTLVLNDAVDPVWVEQQVDYLLRRRRGLTISDRPNFRILNFSTFREQATRIQNIFALLLGAIGSVTLIVGGVGVMNIMLVSVTERTREIGLRMAVGARKSDILFQFMIEAILLCGIAGLIGLGLGWGLSGIINQFGVVELTNSLTVASLAFGSSVLVGIIFGILPARRAANLKPVEALRYG